jgi:hypothetical protein
MYSNIVKILEDEIDMENLLLLAQYFEIDTDNLNGIVPAIANKLMNASRANMDSDEIQSEEETEEQVAARRERARQARERMQQLQAAAKLRRQQQEKEEKEEEEKVYDPECNNPMDNISQEEWSEDNPPQVKIEFLNSNDPLNKKSITYCYTRDELQNTINENNEYYHWLKVRCLVPMEDMGYGGNKSQYQIYYLLPPMNNFIIYMGGYNSEGKPFTNKYYIAIPIAKNVRIGKQFGVSGLHGQSKYTIYLLLQSDGIGGDILQKYGNVLRDFYIKQIISRGFEIYSKKTYDPMFYDFELISGEKQTIEILDKINNLYMYYPGQIDEYNDKCELIYKEELPLKFKTLDFGTDIFREGYNVVWGNNMWMACGKGINSLAWSTDGLNWNGLGNVVFDYCKSVAWNGKMWIAVGKGDGYTIAFSNDGLNWNPVINDIFEVGNGIAWGDNKWIAVGKGNNTIALSNDGLNWEGLGNDIFNKWGNGVAFGNDVWVAVGYENNQLAWSRDGKNWTGYNDIFTKWGNSVIWTGDLWFAVGAGLYPIKYSYGVNNNEMDWDASGVNIETYGKSIEITDIATDNKNKWIATCNSIDTSILISNNGLVWEKSGNTTFTKANGVALVRNNAVIVGIGNNSLSTYKYVEENNVQENNVRWYSATTYNDDYDNLGFLYNINTIGNPVEELIISSGNGLYSINYNEIQDIGWGDVAWKLLVPFNDLPMIIQDLDCNDEICVAVSSGDNSIGWANKDDLTKWNGLGRDILEFGESVHWSKAHNKFIVCGSNNETGEKYSLAWSNDGKTWNGISGLPELLNITSNDAGICVAVGDKVIVWSNDCINWNKVENVIDLGLSVDTDGKNFIAVGKDTSKIAYSTDGINWRLNDVFRDTSNNEYNNIKWKLVKYCSFESNIRKLWVLIGRTPDKTELIAYSIDGINWILSMMPINDINKVVSTPFEIIIQNPRQTLYTNDIKSIINSLKEENNIYVGGEFTQAGGIIPERIVEPVDVDNVDGGSETGSITPYTSPTPRAPRSPRSAPVDVDSDVDSDVDNVDGESETGSITPYASPTPRAPRAPRRAVEPVDVDSDVDRGSETGSITGSITPYESPIRAPRTPIRAVDEVDETINYPINRISSNDEIPRDEEIIDRALNDALRELSEEEEEQESQLDESEEPEEIDYDVENYEEI